MVWEKVYKTLGRASSKEDARVFLYDVGKLPSKSVVRAASKLD